MVTLANPVGLYMDHIDLTGWEVPGGGRRLRLRHESRAAAPNAIERLVVESPTDEFDVSDIRIGGVPMRYGGQIAECITVKLVGAASALGSVDNKRATLQTAAAISIPADAREIFTRGRGGPTARR